MLDICMLINVYVITLSNKFGNIISRMCILLLCSIALKVTGCHISRVRSVKLKLDMEMYMDKVSAQQKF